MDFKIWRNDAGVLLIIDGAMHEMTSEEAAALRAALNFQPARKRVSLSKHKDDIIARYNAGERPADIAPSYGSTAKSIANARSRWGVPARYKPGNSARMRKRAAE